MKIDGTTKTFEINFDPDIAILEIKGRSTSENPKLNYQVLLDTLEEYVRNPVPRTIVNLEIEYINSSSSRYMLTIFRLLEDIHKAKKSQVDINWYYEEDDEVIISLGKDFKGIIEVPINLIEIVD